MAGFGGGRGGGGAGHHQHGFKLDMGCVERDEDRGEFLSSCSRLDEKTVFKMVDVKGGQEELHLNSTLSTRAFKARNFKRIFKDSAFEPIEGPDSRTGHLRPFMNIRIE